MPGNPHAQIVLVVVLVLVLENYGKSRTRTRTTTRRNWTSVSHPKLFQRFLKDLLNLIRIAP